MSTDREDGKLEALYAQFGRTAEMAQVMELEAGNLALAYAMIAFDPNNLTDDEKRFLHAVSEDIDRRTFGYLVKFMKKSMNITQSIEDIVNTALEKRNYLTHRFFRTHNFGINSAEGRTKMSEELSELHKAFAEAHAILHGMTHTLNEAFGSPNISQEDSDALLEAGRRVEI